MIRQYVKNYALALFSLCKENGSDISAINDELFSMNKIFIRNNDLLLLLCSPAISKTEKTDVLKNIFEGRITDIVLDFICVITNNSRMRDFSDICSYFKELYYEDANMLEVTVTTTVELSAPLKSKLQQKLEKTTGKNVILIEKTDNKLIGGIIIDYNDTQIDASLKSKLSKLKKNVDSVIA